jgi:hypothetical protein
MMATSKEISVGNVLRVRANGETSLMLVTNIENGRVVLAKANCKGRGRWWLPYEFMKENSTFVRTEPIRPKRGA